ncbi:tape measure domain-containing protein [Gaiella occulta]|uniref:Tape measure domain-containing protein n=1 Tax=Gaiella occulta TaxID=1002870 RepID=A0A7M2YT86_9ACTN|nr:tape measure protein [Gaiella occulta]RDI73313.1 tape measure domain-containing protein [Gaiella occulta]
MARVGITFDGVSRGAVRAARETSAGIDHVGNAARRNEGKVAAFGAGVRRSMLGAAAAIGRAGVVGGGVAAGGLIGSIVWAGFKFDDLKQKSTIAFTTMLGSAAKAKSFLAQLTGFANQTPFELPGLIKSSQQLLAFGFQAKQVVPTLTAVGNAVAGMGGDPQAMDQTIRAIGQIQAKGRLMAEEMMQLNEAGTFSWRALAEAIGTSVPKAMALVQKGAVGSDAFLAAFAENSNKRFAGMMDKQSRTFSGLLSTLKDKFSQTSGTVMQPFFDLAVRGMERLVAITGTPEFTAGVQRLAKWLEEHVVPALKNMVSWVVGNRDRIVGFFRDAARFAFELGKAVGDIVSGLSKLSGALGGWQNTAELAFGAIMLGKVAKLRVALGGGPGGLLGTLAMLTRTPWTIPIGLSIFNLSDKGKRSRIVSDAKQGLLGSALLETLFGTDFGAGNLFGGRTQEQSTSPGGAAGGAVGLNPIAGLPVGKQGAPAFPLPGSLAGSSIIGRPGVGTHNAPDWQSRNATDIAAAANTPVFSPVDGLVLNVHGTDGIRRSGNRIIFGFQITIQGPGVKVFITHVKEVRVRPGQVVKKGQMIARIYDAGAGSHLHFAIDQGDPSVFLGDAASRVTRSTDTPYDFGDAKGLVGDGASAGPKKTPADPAERARARFGLGAISKALGQVADQKTRAQLAKRVRLITGDLVSADTDQEMSAITSRVQKLKDRLADVLGSQSDRQKKAAEKLRDRMREAARRAVEAAAEEVRRRRDVFARAFETVAAKAAAVFDAKTKQMLAGARVSLFGVQFGSGDETPAERALREFREQRDAAAAAAKRADLETRAAAGDPDAVAELAQLALDEKEKALEKEAAAQRQAADDALDGERARIQDERDALRDRFVARLDEIKRGFADETLTAAEAQEQMLELLRSYDVDFAAAGALVGAAFADGFRQSLGEAGIAAADVASAANNLRGARAGLPTSGNLFGTLDPAIATAIRTGSRGYGFAQGGRVPGVYVGRDSVPALLSPGETVIDRSLTRALEQMVSSVGWGGVSIVVSGNTLLGDDMSIARELARRVEPELRRLISYRAER